MAVRVTVERGYRLISDKPTTVRIEGDTVDEVVMAIKDLEAKMKNEAANQPAQNPGV